MKKWKIMKNDNVYGIKNNCQVEIKFNIDYL